MTINRVAREIRTLLSLVAILLCGAGLLEARGDDAFSFERLSEMEHPILTEKEAPAQAVEDTLPAEEPPAQVSKTVREYPVPPRSPETLDEHRGMSIWRSVGALLLVLGALLLVNRWLRGRFPSSLAGSSTRRMRIEERLTIDHRRQLVLVSVDNRELVVAVSPSQISAVAEWATGEDGKDDSGEEP